MSMSEKFKLSKLNTDLPEFDRLTARAKADPLGLIRHCQRRSKEYDEGVRWIHWCLLISLYSAAMIIEKDEVLIDQLVKLPCFSKRAYQPNRKDVLRLVLLAGLNAPLSGKTYKNICHKASLLKPFIKSEIDPAALLSMIVTCKGLKRLSVHLKKEELEAVPMGEKADVENSGIDKLSHEKRSASSENPTNGLAGSTSKTTDDDAVDLDEVVILEVEMTRNRFRRLTEAPDGSTGVILFEQTAKKSDLKRVVATSVRLDRRHQK